MFMTMENKEIESYRKAGKIATEVAIFAKSIIKPGMNLLEIAEKIESKIEELGGKPAFPCNLSINEIAAHDTPAYNHERKDYGLLNVAFGVHVNGYIADKAFSIDLENNEENKKLIKASEEALKEAVKSAEKEIEVWKIGKAIQEKIISFGFSPIRNLSGHELADYRIHAGLTIPNCNNNKPALLKQRAYAIEPFATKGIGMVYDGKLSGIYKFEKRAGVRDSLARKILNLVEQEYKTLPFCQRWIVKKFGGRAVLSLKLLEQANAISQYPQLVEKNHEKVSQAETTILVTDKIEVLA